MPKATANERFWAKVNEDGPVPAHRLDLGPCSLWTACIRRGRAVFGLNGGSVLAHVWAWEQEYGPIPPGLELDHLCWVKHCVRTSHMELVTHAENMRRRYPKKPKPPPKKRSYTPKTHCPAGHSYAEHGRPCRICGRDATRRHRARNGVPFVGLTDEERFVALVRVTATCWFWLGSTNRSGHGQFSVGGKMVKAHRWAYEFFVGPIPDGLVIHHLCGNESCVNPDHLKPITARENTLLGNGAPAKYARATSCRNGHPYTEATMFIDYEGYRKCRLCEQITSERHTEQARRLNESF